MAALDELAIAAQEPMMTNDLTVIGLDDASMACLSRQAKAQCVSVSEQARRILVAVLNSPGSVSALPRMPMAAEPGSNFTVVKDRIL